MYESFLMRRAKWVLVAFAALTLFFGYQIIGLKVDSSNEKMLSKADPAYGYLEEFRRIFGSDEFIVGAFRLPEPAGEKVLEEIEALAEKARRIPHVRMVQSPLRPSGDKDEELDEEEARRILVENPAYSNVLASGDFRSLALIIWLEHLEGDRVYRGRIVQAIRQLSSGHALNGARMYIAGIPVEKNDISAFVREDQQRIVPLMFVLIGVIIFAIFRNLLVTALVLLLLGCSLLWTLGLFAFAGKELNTVTGLIAPVVMIVTLGSVIHFLSHFARLGREGMSSGQAMQSALQIVLAPCFLAALTTAGGLLATATLGVPAVQEFAIFTAGGVMISFFLAVSVFPLLVILFARRGMAMRISNARGLLDRSIEWVVLVVSRYPWAVVGMAIFVAMGAGFGLMRLDVDTDLINSLRQSAPLYQATRFVDRYMGGVNSLEVMIDKTSGEKVVDPDTLRKVAGLQDFLESFPSVTKTYSIVDGLIFSSGLGPGRKSVPPGAEGKLLYAMVAGDTSSQGRRLGQWINADFTKLRIAARMKSVGSLKIQELSDRVKAYTRQKIGEGLRVRMTGNALLLSNMSIELVSRQVVGLFLAVVFVLSAIGILFRSFGVMLLSAIPNLIPIGVVFGLMGWLGIPLNVPTAMISSVAMGLVVDGTIHFLYTFRLQREKGAARDEAVSRTIRIAGKPIAAAALILVGGFSIGLIGNFIPVVYFSVFTGVTILVAVLCDLLFLPAVIMISGRDWGIERR